MKRPPPYGAELAKAVRRGLIPSDGVYVYVGDPRWVHDLCATRATEDIATLGWMPDKQGKWRKPSSAFWPVAGAIVFVVVGAPDHYIEADAVALHIIESGKPDSLFMVGAFEPCTIYRSYGAHHLESATCTELTAD